MSKKIVPINWDLDKIVPIISEHGFSFARMPPPRGMVTRLKSLGPLKGHCFERCLQITNSIPDKMWYCEGIANGAPHAWLSPKILEGKVADANWALDPTWPWKTRKYQNGKPLDKINYYGVRLEGHKVVKWLLDKSERTGYASCSLFRSIGEWSIEEFL